MIFGQIPWIIPFGKSRFFALFKTLFFSCKNHSFLSIISKTIFSDLICPKNRNEKNFDCWAKTEDYPLRKMSIFLDLSFGSRNLSFLSKIWKKMFSDLIIPKTKMKRNSIFGQKPWTNPLEKCRSWNFLTVHFSGLKIIFFLSTRSKNDLYRLVLYIKK